MTSMNYEESQEHGLRITEYISKNLELKILKNVSTCNYDILERQKAALKEEYKKLDNVNYAVWAMEDKFCNDVWDFSLKHNFNKLFDRHTNNIETIKLHNCKYNSETVDDVERTENADAYNRNIISKLNDEIDSINKEIINIRMKDIEQDLKNFATVLSNLKSLSDEISELIRLSKITENSLNISNVPIYQQLNKSRTAGFISARKLCKQYSRALIEKKSNSNTKMETTGYNVQNNIRFGKFVMKKRSLISLKFEQKLKKSA